MSYLEDFFIVFQPIWLLSFYYLFPTSVSYGLRIYSLYDFNLLDFVETSFVAQYTIDFVSISQALDNYLYCSTWGYSVSFVH